MKWLERARNYPILRRFHWFGIVGSLVVIFAIAVSMAAYIGTDGERFSPLNHFISELGQVGVSRLAFVFNAGLVVAGVLFVPFSVGLGLALGGWWAAAGAVAGLVSAVAVACVGVFPMNDLPPHYAAAMTFFRAGLATVLLFGVAIQRQRPDRRVVDRRANIAGLAAAAAFAAFLAWIAYRPGGATDFHEGIIAARPAVWTSAILEWSILATTIAWFFVVGVLRRSV
jgi:hypothetical membrane protein